MSALIRALVASSKRVPTKNQILAPTPDPRLVATPVLADQNQVVENLPRNFDALSKLCKHYILQNSLDQNQVEEKMPRNFEALF